MGFLKRLFRNVFHEGMPAETAPSSFERLSEEQLEAHLRISKYGQFQLTDAIRPSYDLQVVPAQGYRHDIYEDEETKSRIPVLMASASRENMFDLFLDLLEPLGSEVDVVLETSHTRQQGGHEDLYREHIDMPVLKSVLWDFEDLLLNDGCTGLAVINSATPQEIQFDEHKLLIVYGEPLRPFEAVFQRYQVRRNDELRFVTEAEHVHSSNEKYFRGFDELRMQLGMDSGFYA
ncbi:MAG: hypothetical protein FJ297_02375 [Planctomycetes bacterium]|nr:hypothetical protein [Planctomycetota bacterium]